MIIDLYILCPKCGKHLTLKQVDWHSKPTCENCKSSFNVIVNSNEMKIRFEEVNYLE